MKIVIVDDEPIAARKLSRLLKEIDNSFDCTMFYFAEDLLEYAKENTFDIIFLDISMQDMSGLDVARELMEINPKLNIIFCTGYEQYAVEAFSLFCSGYLLKPATLEMVKKALDNLRFPVNKEKKVRFQCFGNFEVFYGDEPIVFEYKKTKELLAYLVDRKGVDCPTRDIIAILFEDDMNMSYFQRLRRDLLKHFEDIGQENIIRQSKGILGINKSLIECDYYDYLENKNDDYKGEYMIQYSFAETTNSELEDY